MGKRKSTSKLVKRAKPKLDVTFDCVFCNHEKSVSVQMDKEHKIGNLSCKVCHANYQAAINHLSSPIDVYSEWIDACEEAKNAETNGEDHVPERNGEYEEYESDAGPRKSNGNGILDRAGISDEESDVEDFFGGEEEEDHNRHKKTAVLSKRNRVGAIDSEEEDYSDD
ncbi:Transcription elongation factor 1 [Smittium mucronatum]|uniref:Transcription elongation factor 1 homolog n=1 Tax=Smittium mucronatum TaxID=133383 RepID=A0A1R0H4X9_9FUNG|nr:Transcription elongation factor 1 [Smittium mucronatum]